MDFSRLYRWPRRFARHTARPGAASATAERANTKVASGATSTGPGAVGPLAVGALVILGLAYGAFSSGTGLAAMLGAVRQALWLLPFLVALHLGQLLVAGVAWRSLLPNVGTSLATFYRLRIIREGIDSLLPVAQVGGEIVGAKLLSRYGVSLPRAAASVIVDVSLEFLTQVVILLLGLTAMLWLAHGGEWETWIGALVIAAGAAGGLVLAQRLGLLRLLEALWRGIAGRWPTLAGASLDGLHLEARTLYRRPAALAQSSWLHLLAWGIGSVETWAVLNALGVPATPLQSFIVESLGMAGRSAGFAIPAALGAQEGGFVLAAASLGIGAEAALALSIVKRMREILVGSIGLLLWRATTSRRAG